MQRIYRHLVSDSILNHPGSFLWKQGHLQCNTVSTTKIFEHKAKGKRRALGTGPSQAQGKGNTRNQTFWEGALKGLVSSGIRHTPLGRAYAWLKSKRPTIQACTADPASGLPMEPSDSLLPSHLPPMPPSLSRTFQASIKSRRRQQRCGVRRAAWLWAKLLHVQASFWSAGCPKSHTALQQQFGDWHLNGRQLGAMFTLAESLVSFCRLASDNSLGQGRGITRVADWLDVLELAQTRDKHDTSVTK